MKRERRAVWAKRIERWRESGLSVKEFAAEIGVNANTLAGWRWRLLAEERADVSNDGEDASSEEHVKPIEFVEVVAAAGDERFELVTANGTTVRVPARFDAAALKRLLTLLEAR